MFAPSLRLSIEIPSATEISVLKSSWIVRALVSTDVILPSMSPAQASPTATTNTSASATPSIFFIVTPPDRLVSRLSRACAANRRRADRFNGKRRAIAGHLGEARKLTRLCRDWRSGKRRRGSVLQTGVANRGEPGGPRAASLPGRGLRFQRQERHDPGQLLQGDRLLDVVLEPGPQDAGPVLGAGESGERRGRCRAAALWRQGANLADEPVAALAGHRQVAHEDV